VKFNPISRPFKLVSWCSVEALFVNPEKTERNTLEIVDEIKADLWGKLPE